MNPEDTSESVDPDDGPVGEVYWVKMMPHGGWMAFSSMKHREPTISDLAADVHNITRAVFQMSELHG